MSWNIAKPGDQINGPVSITGALTSSSTISGTQIISTVATGTAPLTVASTTNVANLNADLLDGQQGSYYQSADNINAGTLVVGRGGTGASTFTAGRVLFGNGTSALNTSANLFWDNSNNRLGIGTATPAYPLDVNGTAGVTNIRYTGASSGARGLVTTGSSVFALHPDGTTYGYGISGNASGGLDIMANQAGQDIRFWCGTSNASPTNRFTIGADGVCTWSNVGGNSGTAMTLNGTGLGVGVSPAYKLDVAGLIRTSGTGYDSVGAPTLYLRNTTASTGRTFALNSFDSGGFQIFDVTASNATRLLIDSSGNVGINTTTPAYTLDVNGTARIGTVATAGRSALLFSSGASNFTIEQTNNGSGSHVFLFKLPGWTNDAFVWNRGSTQLATLNGDGNLGLGVTPSAWSTYKAFDLPNAAYISSGNNWMSVMYNAYLSSSGYLYKGNGYASHYLQQDGQHIWYKASSGTAGNAITFTPAMTLDASGNLLVGTVSPSVAGVVVESRRDQNSASRIVANNQNSGASALSGIGFEAYGGSWQIDVPSSTTFVNPIEFKFNGTKLLSIKSTGQVNFVGQASDPAGAAAGDVYYNTTTNKLKCYNGTTWNDLF